MRRLGFVYNDGGRKAAGFKRANASDCVCRSIAIATGQPYLDVYHTLRELASYEDHKVVYRGKAEYGRSNPNTGVRPETYEEYLRSLGWKWTPTMFIGQGCKVHMRADELPRGRLIVILSKHMSCVIDGVEHSTYRSDREGTRCVYGYWTPPRRRAKKKVSAGA